MKGRPLTHKQRRKLIEKPFPPIDPNRVLSRSYPWAGVLIPDSGVPTEGRRVWKVTPEDEEAFALTYMD